MFRVYWVRGEERRLIGGASRIEDAREMVIRSAGAPPADVVRGRPRSRALRLPAPRQPQVRWEIVELPFHPPRMIRRVA